MKLAYSFVCFGMAWRHKMIEVENMFEDMRSDEIG
jgi:hypothetical protein